MKKFYVFLVFTLICMGGAAQANYDAFVGTWVYQKNDTVFKIKLQKGTVKHNGVNKRLDIFGGYYLSVKEVVKENYIKEMPTAWDVNTLAPLCNIYIEASSDTPNYLGFSFYDQQKLHLNGKGISGGTMKLEAPDKLHWKLDEKRGLWLELEGTGEPMIPRGFSVPEDCIMTKE